jgi:guanine nucleotide-binding protein subunit alpha
MDDVDPDGLDDAFKFDDYYRQYKVRLSPLQAVESNLKRLLGATEEIQPRKQISRTTTAHSGSPEFFVRSRSWRNFLQTIQGSDSESPRHSFQQDLPALLDSTDVIANGKDDIKALWRDSHIQAMLWKRKTRLEDSAGLSAYSYSSVAFFL